MKDWRKNYSNTERPPKRNPPEELQTDNAFIEDMEDYNCIDYKSSKLSFTWKAQNISEETKKKCRKRTRGANDLLKIDKQILKQEKTRMENEGMACEYVQKVLSFPYCHFCISISSVESNKKSEKRNSL